VPKYLPGATQDLDQPSTARQFQDTCSWSTPGSTRSLLASADIYGFVTGPHGAEQAFNSDVRFNSGSGGASQQPVTGLGDQAVAVFESVGTSRTLLLFVWSSNAEIQISYTINQGPSMPTRAVQLAAAIAIARDLLAGQLSA
jgi:hypothetical protein